MQKKLQYTFDNPNTPEETIQFLKKIIIENIIRIRERKKLESESVLT